MGLNLHNIVRPLLNQITPEQNIIVKTFNGNTNIKGIVAPTYTSYNTKARVQLTDKQKLMHIANINLTWVYKNFYLNSLVLTGLNRALGTPGDVIIHDNITYKIVEVTNNFKTGWVSVVGCQGAPV